MSNIALMSGKLSEDERENPKAKRFLSKSLCHVRSRREVTRIEALW